MTPDRQCDRAWAMTLLDRMLGLLAQEYAATGLGCVNTHAARDETDFRLYRLAPERCGYYRTSQVRVGFLPRSGFLPRPR
jgi:hypothetical protein